MQIQLRCHVTCQNIVTNKHTMQKSHTTLAYFAKEQHNNQHNLHHKLKSFYNKIIIFIHWLPSWNTNKSDKIIYYVNYDVVNVLRLIQIIKYYFCYEKNNEIRELTGWL